MKLLVILAAVALLVWLVRGDRRRAVRKAPPPRPASDASARMLGPEPMVRCAVCGLHLPATDAIAGPDGRQFCCSEHRRGAA
ncbi:hypothetical protein GN316_13725 [Xylophilus sp. Kf1]|nr:hypothetical protein [Xylophilus sp. Kf1]